MKNSVAKIQKMRGLPEGTLITTTLSPIDYSDSYRVISIHKDSIEKITEKILTLPDWVNFALHVRYHLFVKPFGLTTGRFSDIQKTTEGNFEPVPILAKTENEIVMGSDDKHLNYRLSVMKNEVDQYTEVYLNTLVKFNNIWGRLYFLPVRLGHKIVVRSILKRLT